MIAFTVLFKISLLDIGNSIWGSSKNPNSIIFICVSFFNWLGFTPCKAEQLLWGMELQEKQAQKD